MLDNQIEKLKKDALAEQAKIEKTIAPLRKQLSEVQEDIDLLKKRKAEISGEIKEKSAGLPQIKRTLSSISGISRDNKRLSAT